MIGAARAIDGNTKRPVTAIRLRDVDGTGGKTGRNARRKGPRRISGKEIVVVNPATQPRKANDVRCTLGVVRWTKLVDEPLRAFRLLHNLLLVVLPQTPGQFVVVHGWPLFT